MELYAKVPERANLVARIPGNGTGPRLALLSHTDTVHADPGEWALDPWSGEVRDGEIWGRGALDMKGQVAGSAVAIASLAREGFEPNGDLIFVAAADEEVGVDFGCSWLCREHPDAVRAEYVLNEGAGDRVEIGGKALYLCSTAEKMTSPFMLRVHGRAGHASMPAIADNALVKAAKLIQRLGEFSPQPQLEPEVAAFLKLVTGEDAPEPARAAGPSQGDPPARRRADRAAARDDALADDDLGLEDEERDPVARRGDGRLPAAPGTDPGRGRAGDPRRPRRRRLRARVAGGARRDPFADGHAALGRDRELGRGDRAGSRRRRRSAWPDSPTATGRGPRSGRSRTASSRCATWTRSLRHVSSTPRTSGSRSTISSSEPSSCATPPG